MSKRRDILLLAALCALFSWQVCYGALQSAKNVTYSYKDNHVTLNYKDTMPYVHYFYYSDPRDCIVIFNPIPGKNLGPLPQVNYTSTGLFDVYHGSTVSFNGSLSDDKSSLSLKNLAIKGILAGSLFCNKTGLSLSLQKDN